MLATSTLFPLDPYPHLAFASHRIPAYTLRLNPTKCLGEDLVSLRTADGLRVAVSCPYPNPNLDPKALIIAHLETS